MDNNSFYNDQHLTEEELVAYHYGRLSNHEMHRLESHLVDCDLCNDALEGIQNTNEAGLDKHLTSIRTRVGLKEESGMPTRYWIAAAASVILIAIVGYLVIQIPQRDKLIAENLRADKEKSESIKAEAAEKSEDIKEEMDLTASDTMDSSPAGIQLIEGTTEQTESGTDVVISENVTGTGGDEVAANKNLAMDSGAQPQVQNVADNQLTEPEKILRDTNIIQDDSSQDVLIAETVNMEEAALDEETNARAKKAAVPAEATPQAMEEQQSGATENYIAPKPNRGDRSFERYVRRNLKYPDAATQNNIEGEVAVEFTVNTDGSVADFNIKQSLGYGCDEEAIRLIREGPSWIPANRNGIAVSDKITINIAFKL